MGCFLNGHNRYDYDVIVIGAGPGGSEMAYQLATRGHRVAILEKDLFDREKSCGGGIQPLELQEFGPLPPTVVECRITRMHFASPRGTVLHTDIEAATVRRSIYDVYLQQRAREAGARLFDETLVTGIERVGPQVRIACIREGSRRILTCRLVVNAAGASARRLTRAMGIDGSAMTFSVTRHLWLKPRRMSSFSRNVMEIYFLDSLPNGYAWVFPQREVFSVGIGAEATCLQKSGVDLAGELAQLIEQHPIASGGLRDAEIARPLMGGAIPTAALPVIHSECGILVGDSAGFANPVHGGGIYHARKCALIAAPHCDRFLREGDPAALADYDREARTHFFEYETRWDRKLLRVFGALDPLERLIAASMSDAELREAVTGIYTSLRPHRESYQTIERKMIKLIYAELERQAAPFRAIFSARLATLFTAGTPLQEHANELLLNDEAKRLRAVLGVLAADVFGGSREVSIDFALIYELFHTASLIHDDLMDHSDQRRGRATLHARYGLADAIITGDMILARCYSLLGEYADSALVSKSQLMALLKVVGETGVTCCEGQARDMAMSHERLYDSLDDYIAMIGDKTGSLIEGSLKGGAIIGGATAEQIALAARFGRDLGIAFQIIDDSLDLLGGDEANKSVMNDLRQGKVTPMLVHTLKQAGPEERERLLAAVGNNAPTESTVAEVVELYARHGAVEFAQRLSHDYVERARASLQALPPGPARDDLECILDVLGYWGLLSD